MSQRHFFALDLGTTKFCLVGFMAKGKHTPPSFEAISTPAAGMKKGMLADLEPAKAALAQLLDLAEKQFQCDLSKIVVGVAGSHLRGRLVERTVDIPQETVSAALMSDFIAETSLQEKLPFRENLHTVPLRFRVDNREFLDNPLGHSGRKLTGQFFVIDSDQLYLKDMIHLCNQCGLEVSRLYAEPFASASVSLADEQKRLGVAIADIGGGTTDGVVYQNGAAMALFSINVGGVAMTSDLAIGLNLAPSEAERVKTYFGIAYPTDRELKVQTLYGKEKIVTAKEVYNILGPRLLELAELLVGRLKPFKGHLGAGLVLTGGGAEVLGLCDFLGKLLKIPVIKAEPRLLHQFAKARDQTQVEHVFPTKLATAFGLLKLELAQASRSSQDRKGVLDHHYFQQFMNWLKELS